MVALGDSYTLLVSSFGRGLKSGYYIPRGNLPKPNDLSYFQIDFKGRWHSTQVDRAWIWGEVTLRTFHSWSRSRPF